MRNRLKAAVEAARYVESEGSGSEFNYDDELADLLKPADDIHRLLDDDDTAWLADLPAEPSFLQEPGFLDDLALDDVASPQPPPPPQVEQHHMQYVDHDFAPGNEFVHVGSAPLQPPQYEQVYKPLYASPAPPPPLQHKSVYVPPPGGGGGGYAAALQLPTNGQMADEALMSQLNSPGSPGSTSTALSKPTRDEKYRAKLESLMAEWGFQDMATADAFYRRQKRQNQGQTR